MSARSITLLTFGFFALMPFIVMALILSGKNMSGGNEGAHWFFFGGSFVYFLGFLAFYKKWAVVNLTTRQVRIFDESVTTEEAKNILQKYSFLILISSIGFFAAGVVALLVY